MSSITSFEAAIWMSVYRN